MEFYYTYKKQVKIGRNGTLTFGDLDTGAEKSGQEEVEVDVKVSPSWLCRLTVGNTWGQTPDIYTGLSEGSRSLRSWLVAQALNLFTVMVLM